MSFILVLFVQAYQSHIQKLLGMLSGELVSFHFTLSLSCFCSVKKTQWSGKRSNSKVCSLSFKLGASAHVFVKLYLTPSIVDGSDSVSTRSLLNRFYWSLVNFEGRMKLFVQCLAQMSGCFMKHRFIFEVGLKLWSHGRQTCLLQRFCGAQFPKIKKADVISNMGAAWSLGVSLCHKILHSAQ